MFVLVVDDDDDVRDTVASVLEMRMRVVTARDGRDAIETVRSTGMRPAAIILDITMPVMDGIEFLAAQAAEPLLAHVPVVVHTALSDMADLPPTVVGIVQKPASIAALLAAFEACLERRSSIPPQLASGTGAIPPLEPESLELDVPAEVPDACAVAPRRDAGAQDE